MLAWLRDTVVDSPTAVSVSIAAVVADTLYGSARLWLRRRSLIERIAAGSRGTLPTRVDMAAAQDNAGGSVFGLVANELPRSASSPTNSAAAAADTAGSPSSTFADGEAACATLRRPMEENWVSGLLRERGLYTAVVSDSGTGVSTILRTLAAREDGFSYLSLQGVATTGDLARAFREDLGLSTGIAWSPLSFLATRVLRAIAGAVGDRGDVDEHGDDDDDEDDDKVAWRAVTASLGEALATLARRRAHATRRAGNRGCEAPRMPVLVCDHVGDLEEESLVLLQKWASHCASRGWIHVAIVTDNPVVLFPHASANAFRVVSVPDPPVAEVIDYLLRRCRCLDRAAAREIVTTLTGPAVGAVRVVISLIDEAMYHPHPARLRQLANPLPQLPPALSDSGESDVEIEEEPPFGGAGLDGGGRPRAASAQQGAAKVGILDEAESATAGGGMGVPQTSMGATSSGGARSSATTQSLSRHRHHRPQDATGELAADLESGLEHMDLGALVRNLQRDVLAQSFGTSRPLHLYSMQPTGDAALDAVRLAVFALGLRLLQRRRQELARYRAFAASEDEKAKRVVVGGSDDGGMPRRGRSQTKKMDPELLLLDHPVALCFHEALAIVPLRVYQMLPHRRAHLPLMVTFDRIRFRLPIAEQQLLWVISAEPDSAERERARRDFGALVDAVIAADSAAGTPGSGAWDSEILAQLWDNV